MINLEKDYTGEVEVDKTQSKHVRKHLAVSPPQFSSSEDMILTLLISVAATKLAPRRVHIVPAEILCEHYELKIKLRYNAIPIPF